MGEAPTEASATGPSDPAVAVEPVTHPAQAEFEAEGKAAPAIDAMAAERWAELERRRARAGPVPADWHTRATITIPEYAKIMGVGRNTAYEAARVGEVQTIKVRGRVLVCVPALLRQLGC
jgi:hypothetical protein